jgi:hypothetical protein
MFFKILNPSFNFKFQKNSVEIESLIVLKF